MEIHLVGVLHDDPESYDGTREILCRLQPDILGAEWAGEKYEKFRRSKEVRKIQSEIDRQVIVMMKELDINPAIYEAIKRQQDYGEIKAVREYAKEHSLIIIPTESAEERIKADQKLDVKKSVEFYKGYLPSYKREEFDTRQYDWFQKHLNGELSREETEKYLVNNESINQHRTNYQVKQILDAINQLPDKSKFVHIGGLAHLIDDGLSETERGPINLYQLLKEKFRGAIYRHSIFTA